MTERPVMRESLGALAEALIWGLDTYVKAGIDDMKGDYWDADLDSLHEVGKYITHESSIFPDATNLTVTITAHANPDTWSAWAEIQDSGATTFTSKITGEGHISAVNIEDTSTSGDIWMLEIAYGDVKTIIARIRFVSSTIGNLPAITGVRVRSVHIPDDETVYARLMCNTGGATCKLHIRYYIHVH